MSDLEQYQAKLYADLTQLCVDSEAFYHVDQVVGNKTFRIFSYRLASYTDFCRPNGKECRGHTFLLKDDGTVELVSLPPAKFFNAFENPDVMDLEFEDADLFMDKLDGSLISTVFDPDAPYGFRLKSKTSFNSQQAKDAYAWLLLPVNEDLLYIVANRVRNLYTVNMEWTGMTNRIVIAYPEHSLRVLNLRDHIDGETRFPDKLAIPEKYLVKYDTIHRSYDDILKMTGVEGFVVRFKDGRLAKVKNEWYCALHKTKDSITNPKALFEACLFETSDDLRSLFHDDPVSIACIERMENLVRHEYNERSKTLREFYETNRSLSRKDYAILGQQTFKDMFSLAMNLYLGKDDGLKEWMMKNYRLFGITEQAVSGDDQ